MFNMSIGSVPYPSELDPPAVYGDYIVALGTAGELEWFQPDLARDRWFRLTIVMAPDPSSLVSEDDGNALTTSGSDGKLFVAPAPPGGGYRQANVIDAEAGHVATLDTTNSGDAYLFRPPMVLKFVPGETGAWEAAVHGADFTYGFSGSGQMTVSLVSAGTYKINYDKGEEP
jgi:hypothetical protein